MALHSMEMNSKGLLESLTLYTPHHHLISTSPMVSLRPWWKSQEHLQENWWISKCSSKSITSAMRHTHLDRSSFSSWNSSWMTSTRTVISRPSKPINIHQIGRDSLKYRHTEGTVQQSTQSKGFMSAQSGTNKYSSFLANKGQSPNMVDRNCNWNLDCGHSYMIQVPNGRVYRRNSSLKAHLLWWYIISRPSSEKKRKSSLKSTPFKTPSPQRWKPCPSRQTPATWTPDPCYLMNLTHIRHPSSPPPQQLYSPRSPSYSLSCISTSRESSVEPHSQDFTYRQEEISVWTSLHQTPWHWQRTHTWTFSFSAGNVTPSTIQTGEISQSKSQTAFSTMHWTPFKTLQKKIGNWCKLTPFKTLCLYVAHNPFVLTPFKIPVIHHQLTHFKTLCSYTAQNCSNWVLSRSLHWIT